MSPAGLCWIWNSFDLPTASTWGTVSYFEERDSGNLKKKTGCELITATTSESLAATHCRPNLWIKNGDE